MSVVNEAINCFGDQTWNYVAPFVGGFLAPTVWAAVTEDGTYAMTDTVPTTTETFGDISIEAYNEAMSKIKEELLAYMKISYTTTTEYANSTYSSIYG